MTSSPPECQVCLEFYNHTTTVPRVLSCGHSTCETCLRQLVAAATALSPHNLIRCPSCTQLISLQNPSFLPKNIDLLRFAPLPERNTNPQPKQRRFAFSWDIFSHEIYESWKDWVLLCDAVSTDDHVVGRIKSGYVSKNVTTRSPLVDDQMVRLLELGRFGLSDTVLEYSYISKVMSVIDCMNDGQRNRLRSVLRASIRVSRVCRILGLWLDVGKGCLYLVSERMNDGLFDLSVGKLNYRDLLETIGVELCEVLISLRREGFLCGCFGMSCICFDEFGHVHVNLGEVLMKGRKLHECVVKGSSGKQKLDLNAEREEWKVNLLKMDVFVSPEIMLELLDRQGIEMGKGLSYAACNCSDVWLLAFVLLWLVIGNDFVEVMSSYLETVLEGTNEGVSKCDIVYRKFVDKLNAGFETIMGSDLAFLREILVKCFDYAPERRPPLIVVWKSIKSFTNSQSMNNVASLNIPPMKKDIDLCLALNELCYTPSCIRNESSISTLNKKNDDEVDLSLAREATAEDVVQGLASGKIKCADLVGHLGCITGFCVGGGFLFSSSFDKTVIVWSLEDFTLVHTFRGHEQRIMAMVFVDQEKPLCISGDNGGGICVWEVIRPFSQNPLKKWNEDKDWRYSGIRALAFSESGYLYTGSGDKTIKAWSLRDESLLCIMEGHKAVVSTLAIRNGVLYSGSLDGTVRLWGLHNHSPLAVFGEDTPGTISPVLSLYAEHNVVVASYENGLLKIWIDNVLKSSKLTHSGAVFSVMLEDNWLLSGGWDKTLKIQEIKRTETERTEIDTEILHIGSIDCDSAITALMYWQGILFVGDANKSIKAFLCPSVRRDQPMDAMDLDKVH